MGIELDFFVARRCIFIEKVKEKKIAKQNVKVKGSSKPKELVQRCLSSGAERIGQNIHDAGRLEKQEDMQECQAAYGVNKTEAAASVAARNAYTMGRKIAEQRELRKSNASFEPKEKNNPELELDMNVEASLDSETNQHDELSKSEGRYYEPPEHLEAKTPGHKPAGTIREKETSPFIEREIKSKAMNSTVKEKEIVSLAKADNKTVREKRLYTEQSGIEGIETNGKDTNIKTKNSAIMPQKAQIKTLDKVPIRTKEAAMGDVVIAKADTAAVISTPIIKQKTVAKMNVVIQPDIKIKKTNEVAEKTAFQNLGNVADVAPANNVLKQNSLGSLPVIRQKITYENSSAVQPYIKTREAYRATEMTEEEPQNQRLAKVRLEQGRELAKKNLSGKRFKVQDNKVEVSEEAAAGSTDYPEAEPQLQPEPSLRNEAESDSRCNRQVGAERQKAVANIKTREYLKNGKLALNSVRKSRSDGQKLFGKQEFNDVTVVGNAEPKTAIKGSLAGVKEKTVSENKTLGVQEAGRATSYRGINNNVFGYFYSNNKLFKRSMQFLRRIKPKNGKELLAAAAGLGSALAVVIIICLMGSLFASPFGIFFSGADTMSDAVAELNAEFSQRIEQIKAANVYDEVQITNAGSSAMAANWPDVLAVYAVLTTMDDSNPYDAISLDAVKKARLREIFWAMNQVGYEVRTIYDPEIDEEIEMLYITVSEKDCWQMADAYGFSIEQRQMLAELKQPEYQEMFMALVGSFRDIVLTQEEIEEIIANLPADLSEARRQIVLTAYQLEGKVNYFWGGKSLVFGWDSRWGTPQTVWAAGSVTTGMVRPFGLDCSGFVDWVFYNASGGGFVMGRGGGAASQHSYCTSISWAEAKPGDLVFYPDDSHVGIVCGFDQWGNIQIIHCTAGYNNVVVTGKGGFTAVGRPDYFSD